MQKAFVRVVIKHLTSKHQQTLIGYLLTKAVTLEIIFQFLDVLATLTRKSSINLMPN